MKHKFLFKKKETPSTAFQKKRIFKKKETQKLKIKLRMTRL